MSELLQRKLADLRREVIEGRNFIIPTSDLLRMLHTETRVFGARRKEFERRQLAPSAVAYASLALLAAGAGLLLSFARTSDAKRERDRMVAELKAFTRSVDKERAEQAAIASARHSAREAYRMMTDLPGERRLEGITALAKVDESLLDPFERRALADRATSLRHELAQAALYRGKEAFRKKEWGTAGDEFSRCLKMQPSVSQQVEASFRLGAALVQQHKYEPAVAALKTFLEKDTGGKNREVGMSLLAQAYLLNGNPEKAAAVGREFSLSRRTLPSPERASAELARPPPHSAGALLPTAEEGKIAATSQATNAAGATRQSAELTATAESAADPLLSASGATP